MRLKKNKYHKFQFPPPKDMNIVLQPFIPSNAVNTGVRVVDAEPIFGDLRGYAAQSEEFEL